ncbi:uncharacterized protein LOC116344049 [Contarinia nasturtii]|uniref:uncharacterized protein LOC116344049 n=1 Tax=Contarinia nasturtii TaxID=265458 RepID=UPI0012D386D5|nr:uncharacterized protein LOC116344049 [Contarinia nasturtii]
MRFFGDKFMSMWFILKLCLLISNVNIGDCNILSELKKPNTPVTNEIINYFIKFVREKYNYDMIEVDFNFRLENYPAIPPNTYDIQILYSNLNLSDAGHYTCVFYDAYYKTVYIYNRLYDITNAIADEHFPIIENRYPMRDHEVCVKPKTEQYDEISSGLFAIAYATTLILEKDPSSYTFKMNVNYSDKSIHLREHISEMFQAKELSLFPQCLVISYVNVIDCTNKKGKKLERSLAKKYWSSKTDETINYFIEIVREKYNFDMIRVDFNPQLENYPAIPPNTYDIQIVYSNVMEHFLCIYYDPNPETLYIYDSYFSNSMLDKMDEHSILILENRYPMRRKVVWVQPKTEQYDDTSNGPLTIAYATTLILNKTPATYGFKMHAKHPDKAIHLRKHIFEMFQKKELSLFTRSNRLDIDYISESLINIDPDIMKQLMTPNKLFSYRTISIFTNLVESTTNFDMISINFVFYPELIPIHNRTKNDVQILASKGIDEHNPGHYMCIFYNAGDKTIYVYDSQRLDEQQMHIVNARYPYHQNITYIHPKTKQKDRSSCGPFAIAYATSLILGHDPKTLKLKTNSILTAAFFTKKFDYSATFREHILRMFQSKKLLPFPEEVAIPSCFDPQSSSRD